MLRRVSGTPRFVAAVSRSSASLCCCSTAASSASSSTASAASAPLTSCSMTMTTIAPRAVSSMRANSMSAFGSMVPFQGYVTNDIVSAPVPGGGQHKRGVVAVNDLPYDREIMRVPAYLMYVGDGPPRKMVPGMVRTILKRFVEDKRHASYINKRMLTLMVGGNPVFRTEDDVRDLILDVEGATLAFQKGLLSTLDVHRLGCAIWFNRTDIEYKGQKGLALFPEVSYFNHSCEPNVKLEYYWDVDTGDYVCVARTLRPIHSGDQLLIHYLPECVDLPLSRFQRALQNRWSFTCLCNQCRTRVVLATLAAGCFMMLTMFVPLAVYSSWQRKEKLVQAGIA